MDGALMEVGPFRIKNEKTIVPNNGSWNKYANLLFVDQPIGVGLSTSDTDSYLHELPEMAADMMTFLDKYLSIFPEKQTHEFYLAGESYAGQYIPYLAQAINERNKNISDNPGIVKDHGYQTIDLKGLLIGNGWIDPVQQYLSYVPFAYHAGLVKQGSSIAADIEQKHRECAKSLDKHSIVPISDGICDRVLNTLLQELFQATGFKKTDPRACVNIYDVRLTDSFSSCGMNWPPDLAAVTPFLRRPQVVDALNIDRDEQVKWKECSGPVSRAFQAANSPSSITLLPGIIADGIQILMFNGDQDLICNHFGNTKLIQNMRWGGEEIHVPGQPPSKYAGGFKPDDGESEESWYVDGVAAGSFQNGRNLTYIKLFNASHMAPFDVPEISQVMLNQFIGIPNFDRESQKPKEPEKPAAEDTESESESKEHEGTTTDKEIEEATWNAYYKAGGFALVVVIILTCGLTFFVWRSRRLMRQTIMLNESRPRGVHYEDGSRSGDSMDGFDSDQDQPTGFVNSLFSGLSRWHKPHRRTTSRGSNKYYLAGGAAALAAGAGGSAVPLTTLDKRDSLDSMLGSDQSEDEDLRMMAGGSGPYSDMDLESGESPVREIVIERPEHGV